jgi:GT2 family glycosyltransferase
MLPKVAAYTSSLDDKRSLKRCIQAILDQTYPVAQIIVVDNRSSDGTTLEVFPDRVTFICHIRNLGTSGAAATAMEYALAENYGWLWVLDQDTIPRKNALEKLMDLYKSFDCEFQSQIGILGSSVILDPNEKMSFVHLLTSKGTKLLKVNPSKAYCECDTTIWSGSLYNLQAVKKVGLPRFGFRGYWEDFCLDWGDLEFGFRFKRAGYKVLVVPSSVIDHRIGRVTHGTLLGRKVFTSHHSPLRRYLSFRNMVYFWIYIHPARRLLPVIFFLGLTLGKTIMHILLMEKNRREKTWACLRGSWDGLCKNLHRRY